MRMPVERFKEHTVEGDEADAVSLSKPSTLKLLEEVPALLMYETGVEGPSTDSVRYGFLRGVRVAGTDLVFRFSEEGRFARDVVVEYADRLDLDDWEFRRTHWAVKEGGIPSAMLDELVSSYDVVFSFAGENRAYVEEAADYLRAKGVKIFYDLYEEASLWGKNLAEHFDVVYRRSGRYCVVFISAAYKKKMWTRHERRSALSRAVTERAEYILPARFDDTDISGIPPAVGHISLAEKSPTEFAKVVLKKLGRPTK